MRKLILGRDLRLRVVAEGIERPGQLSFLQTHDGAKGQGFLFWKALFATDVEARWVKVLTWQLSPRLRAARIDWVTKTALPLRRNPANSAPKNRPLSRK